MRVPVRRLPQTRVSEQQQAFARPAQPLNTAPLTDVIEGFRDQLLSEQEDRQRVELNRRLLQETNELQTDFAARRTNPEISLIDFAATTNSAYTERHSTLLEQLRQGGYREDLIDDFDHRLGVIRQGFFERGLGHQLQQLDSRAGEEIEETTRQSSQYAATDYRNYATARDTLLDSIRRHPDLTEARRAELEDQQLAVVRDAAGRAFAIQNPQEIIRLLDPQGLTAPNRSAVPSATSVPTGPVAANSPYNTVLGNGRFGTPSRPITEMTLGEVYDFGRNTLIPNSRAAGIGRDSRGLVGSSAVGAYQITSSTLEDIAPTVLGANWREQRFTPDVQDRLAEHLFNLSRGSAQAMRNRWEGLRSLSTAEVNRVRQLPWAEARAVIARVESSATPEQLASVRVGESTTGASPLQAVETIDLPASQSEQGVTVPERQAPTNDISSIVTGNALLDDLNGVERLQLLGLAREQLNRVAATARAQMDVTLGNINAEAMNNGGEIATPIPSEQEVLQVYGPVEGPQRWAQVQQARATGRAITTFRTQSATDIQQALDTLRPRPGSPTYNTQLEVYQNAERAAQAILTERERDPAAYAMRYFPAVREAAQRGTNYYYAELDRVYETLGINPANAPVMTADAARQMTEQYRSMSPSQRREFMRQNMAQMGEDRFRRFARGMEGTTVESDARIFALLRTYPGQTGQVANLYHEILEGREIIAQDPARRPRAEQVTAMFREHGLSSILVLMLRLVGLFRMQLKDYTLDEVVIPLTLIPIFIEKR